MLRNFIFLLIVLSSMLNISKAQTEEDFKQFLEIFSYDSLYQREHIIFPYMCIIHDEDAEMNPIIDTLMLSSDDIDCMFHFLHVPVEFGMDEYYETYEVRAGIARVYLNGVDNGINVCYYFLRKNDSWYLFKQEDRSY